MDANLRHLGNGFIGLQHSLFEDAKSFDRVGLDDQSSVDVGHTGCFHNEL